MSKSTEMSPWSPSDLWLSRWPDWFDRMFLPFGRRMGALEEWNPRMEMKETTDGYVMTFELPGIKSEDVKLSVQADSISVSGEKKEEKTENEQHAHLRERTYGAFQRYLTFPSPINADDVDAEMKNGILIVKVKKSKEALPKKIKVRG